ncbi:hypothetical protein [Mammaliicoccus lentus]|uniref:hypothetical protein n=1 Tax=Mammaliicoccus lentus TaxID=42858 RepID=UPI0007D971BF|nr:hypothetical protein [Mammaliicoccus lentus]OAO25174.1 hypothetical protein AXY34_01810 [Mammaliicoccus lentus]
MGELLYLYEYKIENFNKLNSKIIDFLNNSEKVMLEILNNRYELNNELKWLENNFQNVILTLTMNEDNKLFDIILRNVNLNMELLVTDYNINDKATDFIDIIIDLERKLNRLSDTDINNNFNFEKFMNVNTCKNDNLNRIAN